MVATPPSTHFDRVALVLRTADGCDLHPSCLSCPRPTCIFDEEKPHRSPEQVRLMTDQQAEVERMTRDGVPASKIARRLGVSVRTVYRVRATCLPEAA